MFLVGDFIPKNSKICLPLFDGGVVLANLEGPVCVVGLPPSGKVGVCLHSAPFEVPGKWAFSLANNHTMDFQEEGLRQTRQFLSGKGFEYAGAGENEVAARRPMILAEHGKRIAVFSCCERQFGMATERSAGVAEMGVWLYEAIRSIKARGEADWVIVSCHAASEFCPWPAPSLRNFYHSLVDVGADVIHGHHSHVPQGWEVYKGKPIFFGLGNFIVKIDDWRGSVHYGWSNVVEINWRADKIHWCVRPYFLAMKEGVIHCNPVTPEQQALADDYMGKANFALTSPMNCEACWQEAACRLYPRLYEQPLRAASSANRRLSTRDCVRKLFFAFGDVVRAVAGRELKTRRSGHYAKVLYNYLNCASHVELIRTALGVETGVLPDMRTRETSKLAEEIIVV